MRQFQRRKGDKFIGSVSAIGKFNNCQRAFYHQYIAFNEKDFDYKIPKYFSFGSAFHSCLEWCSYNGNHCGAELIRKACELYQLSYESDGAKLAACLRSYFANAKPLKVIAMEEEFVTDDWVFIIDAIMADDYWWYIVDNKTTGIKLDPLILTKLRVDLQMGLYANHAKLIAERFNLPREKFYGICYREVEKPRLRPKENETYNEFTKRCGEPAYRESYVGAPQLQLDQVINSLTAGLTSARQISSEEQTTQNMRSCKNMGEVCAYYSRCYGKTHTEAQKDSLDDCDKF